jgi:class 3 adenylate cyclase
VTLDYYAQSLSVYDSIGDLEGKSRILNNFGTVYYMKGTDDKSLEYYFKSLEVAEQIGNKGRIATAYSNIANVYHNKRATTNKALDFFLKALNLSEEIEDKNIIGGVCVNLGEIYMELNKDDSALYYFQKSLMAYENTINIPYPLRDMGEFYAKRKDFPNAIQYLERAYEMARKFDSKLDMTQSLLALGDVYLQTADPKSALAAYKKAESIAAAIPAYKELNDAYAGIATSYGRKGNYAAAYDYQKKFSNLSDTLNNQVLADKLTNLQTNFEIQTRQNQINLLTKDKKLQELDLKSQQQQITFITGGLVLLLIIAIIIFRNNLQKAKINKLLDKQKDQIEALLLNILPSEIASELQRNGQATPRYYENVSVLFTDFKGFTQHADALSPQEIVSELNSCFMAFDDIIEKYNLEKIKTIGDSYMCAGGIPIKNEFHAVNMVRASLEMQQYMKKRNEQRVANGMLPWDLRIGINVGPVVAGVVGRKKYAYDIWGSTVNIASRMESNGEPGQVNISASTYDHVKKFFACKYRGKIFAKNVGEIDMYFVESELSASKPQPQLVAQHELK